jgi:hypothetical protein
MSVMTQAAPIDTRKCERRKLTFKTPEDMFAEVERIVAAERAGTLRCTGNWTVGQILGHLAFWAGTAYNDYPLKPPAWVKMILRLMGKKRFTTNPMPVGVRIPGVEGGTLGTEACGLDEGLARFNKAWERLKKEVPTRPHAIFGPLTHDEFIQGNLRHAELHLSYLHPR